MIPRAVIEDEFRRKNIEIVTDIEKYKEDMGQFKNNPLIIVKAKSTEDVVEAVKIANKYKIPIVAWGAGTSLTGAPVTNNGILVDVSSIRFFEFDDVNWVVHVGVG
ncbi:MAG: FAD-dependent oxidoreductase, partial [Sulfolobales archaeon]